MLESGILPVIGTTRDLQRASIQNLLAPFHLQGCLLLWDSQETNNTGNPIQNVPLLNLSRYQCTNVNPPLNYLFYLWFI
jgi:hypothetical protein